MAMLTSCDPAISPAENSGTIDGAVQDASDGTAITGVTVTLYSSSGAVTGSTTTNALGAYSIPDVSEGTAYYAVFAKASFYSETYRNITVTKDITTYLATLLQVSTGGSGTGIGLGTIKNAFDGTVIESATLKFYAGINSTDGSLLYTTTTDSSGNYSVSTVNLGSGGNFTAEISKSGYTTTTFTVTLVTGTTKTNQNGVITPTITSDEYRAVLEWGASPADLDSHMTGPTGTGSDRFHVYFAFSYRWHPTSASSGPTADVALDTDDRNAYEPETITIYNKKDGEYRYYIHNYSNLSATSAYPSSDLSNSGARVKVYKGSTLVADYHVPTGVGGNCWDVFKLDGTTITPLNALSYIDDYATGRTLMEKGKY